MLSRFKLKTKIKLLFFIFSSINNGTKFSGAEQIHETNNSNET